MNVARRLALVIVCVVCLLLVASALPAADPRIETSSGGSTLGSDSGTAAENSQTPVASTPTPQERTPDESAASQENTTAGTDDQQGDTTDGADEGFDPEISFDGSLIPGNTVFANVTGLDGNGPVELFVDGEKIGNATERGTILLTVPEAESMQVSLPSLDTDWAVDISTDATVRQQDNPIPGKEMKIATTVASEPLAAATVSLNGTEVASTNEDGNATVTLPETEGTVTLSVERGPVSGTTEIEVPALDFDVETPVLFPGTPALVEVTADGIPVENATISANGDEKTLTGEDGTTRIQLPVADAVTLRATVGAAGASETISGIYLRTTVVFVIVPGLLIGGVWTYLRVVSKYGFRRRRRHVALGALFIGLGELFGAIAVSISAAVRSVRNPTVNGFPSLPRFGSLIPNRPSVSIGSVLSFGSVPSLGGIGSISFPSWGRTGGGGGGGSSSLFSILSSGDDDNEESHSQASPATRDSVEEPTEERTPREELRGVWHAFLDRLGVDDRETLTPGQAARRAIRAGYPARSVRRLLALFRLVEYSDREPSTETVAKARETAATLADHEPEDESQ